MLLSVVVAILACYTALKLAAFLPTAKDSSKFLWLAGSACALGVGIWSVHFLSVLALRLPIPIVYIPSLTLLSLLPAIVFSAIAVWLMSREHVSPVAMVAAVLCILAGSGAMHFLGMAANNIRPQDWITHLPALHALSIGGFGWSVALLLLHRYGAGAAHGKLARRAAAVVMGLTIAGMQYSAMTVEQFANIPCCTLQAQAGNGWLSILIFVITGVTLSVPFVVSVITRRMEAETSVLTRSLAEANQELSYLAMHDSVTKLPNRTLLQDRLNQMIQRSNAESDPVAVLSLCLDGVKAVTDAYSHRVSDLLLQEVGRNIEGWMSARATLARVGTDEFVFVSPIKEPEEAATLAEEIVSILQHTSEIEEHEVHLTATIGIAIFPQDGREYQSLLRNADAASSYARVLGSNRYCFFEASMNNNVESQLHLLHDLRLAVVRRQLVLYYQPKFDAATHTIVGVEALLRWMHPSRGMIPPDQFIPLAEKSGLILPIGEWVLDEACRQMRAWKDAGYDHWTVAVNLSALQFCHPGLTAMVKKALDRHHLEPQFLTLELTESTAMRDVEASMAILKDLSEMGVRISIDDFGTGYSSLLYLKRLPASELKIDRGFIRELAENTEDAAIVSAIIALGTTLNLDIVAEGVETTEQQRFLTRLGCRSLQGFLLGHPVPPEEVLGELAAKVNDEKIGRG